MSQTTFTPEESQAIAENSHVLLRMVCLPGGLVGLYFLAYPWPSAHPAVMAGWTLFTAYFLFCWTSCFHETAHQTLSDSKPFSIALGRMLGIAMFVPYTCYRESHIRHHAYLNKPTDWELWPYSDPNTSIWFRRVFVWFDLCVGIFMSPWIYSRIYFHKDSPLKSPEVRRSIRYEYLAMITFWATVLGLVAYFDAWLGFLTVWCIPHFLAGVFQSGRKLTEHLGMSSYDPMLGTRTVLSKRNWITRMGSFVNFDIFIHGPHHRHPRVAHNVLGRKMDEYIETHPDTDYPLYQSYWRATFAMFPHMVKNPGVGMNVGAPAPTKAKNENVENFVADVSAEVLADEEVIVKEARPSAGGW